MAKKSTFVPDWLAKRSALSPHKTAIIAAETGEKISYADWNARACRTARFLCESGIQKGDRVAILAPTAWRTWIPGSRATRPARYYKRSTGD
ncbi:MAG: AMP-binding protein [Gammaproteobacteria bacterium]|nr:AMP-binding protein [Gammaproteobacteria bacterium]